MYSVDYGQWILLALGGTFHLSGDGEHNIRWYSEDNAGNREAENSRMIVVDDAPPSSTLAVGDPKYVGSGNWVTSLTQMSLAATDSGVLPVGPDTTYYRIWDGTWGPWSSYSSPFKLPGGDGSRQIEYYTDDLLGNSEGLHTVTMIVDNTPPALTLEPLGNSFAIGTEFSLSVDDGTGSGVALVWICIDGGSYGSYTGPLSPGLGQHRIFYKAIDKLGNPTESSRVIEVVEVGTHSLSVSYNYKPTVAFVFSVMLLVLAAFSGRKRPMKYGKSIKRRIVLSLAVLPLPFLIAEAATGMLSVSYEFLRIPPLLGWGTVVDTSVLVSGVLFLVLRSLVGRKGKKGKVPPNKEKSKKNGSPIPEPPED